MNTNNGSIHPFDSLLSGHLWSVAEPSSDGVPVRAVPTAGSRLTESDYTALDARWTDRGLADLAQLRRVDSLTGAAVVGRTNGNYAGSLIPYFHPESGYIRDCRLRRDHPDIEYDSAGNLKEKQKYLSAPGRSNMLYLPPSVGESLLRDPTLPVVITEGEFKTLALWRAANRCWIPEMPGSPSGSSCMRQDSEYTPNQGAVS